MGVTINVCYRLVPFANDADAAIVHDLAQLHLLLLPESPVALLGTRFTEQFYYRLLPRANLIFGAVAYIDQRAVGFIVTTRDPNEFISKGLGKYWLHLTWIMLITILTKPQAIINIWRVVRLLSVRGQQQGAIPADGEILSLGVLSEYLKPRFIQSTGLRISHDLMQMALGQLKQRGSTIIRALVQADNTSAKLFYMGLGWQLCQPGEPKVKQASIEFRKQSGA